MTRHVIVEDQDGPIAWVEDTVSDRFRLYVFAALVITLIAVAFAFEVWT